MIQLTVDSKVQTPTKRLGIVITPPGNEHLPLHCLVLFPSGDRMWILAEILERVAS